MRFCNDSGEFLSGDSWWITFYVSFRGPMVTFMFAKIANKSGELPLLWLHMCFLVMGTFKFCFLSNFQTYTRGLGSTAPMLCIILWGLFITRSLCLLTLFNPDLLPIHLSSQSVCYIWVCFYLGFCFRSHISETLCYLSFSVFHSA